MDTKARAQALSKDFNLSSAPVQSIIYVDVNVDAFVSLCEDTYSVFEVLDPSCCDLLSRDEFVAFMKLLLVKRLDFVERETNGCSEYPRIGVNPRTRVAGPIGEFLAGCGRVTSVDLGVRFMPIIRDLSSFNLKVDNNVLRQYNLFVLLLSRVFEFSDALPSQPTGNWSYILSCKEVDTGNHEVTYVTSPSREALPVDAFLAAIVNKGRLLNGILYGHSYGSIPSTSFLVGEYINAYVKGGS